jgi:dethiobiotin synthetase/adenosylmethionine--8-amino-7-oxononanoate aminotransferase
VQVIYDEVFTGCWRLGHASGADILGAAPDLACYAKLLTGGAAPLAATLASQEVFGAFQGSSKLQALLHGHSYTAYPLGCAAAATSLRILQSARLNPNLCSPEGGRCQAAGQPCSEPCGRLWQLWDEARVRELSRLPHVKRALVLGTVMAVELDPARLAVGGGDGGGGYISGAAAGMAKQLRQEGVYVRPLGSLLYFMCTPTSSRRRCDALLARLDELLRAVAPAGLPAGGEGAAPAEVEAVC